jgi:hypothetical protein
MRQEFIDGLGSLLDFNLEAYNRLNAKTKLEVLFNMAVGLASPQK